MTDTRSCEDCKEVLEELEKVIKTFKGKKLLKILPQNHFKCLLNVVQIDDEANDYGFTFVTNAERAAAKKFGITTFPTLVVFRHKEPLIYEGTHIIMAQLNRTI